MFLRILTRATRRNISEEAILHSHRRGNLKSFTVMLSLCINCLLNDTISSLDYTAPSDK
jgi:hypothetical protein